MRHLRFAPILALDPGERRIGVALSDATGTLASPYGVVERMDSRSDTAAALAEVGLPAIGLWAQVPHYASPYVSGAIALVRRVETHLTVTIGAGSLEEEDARQRVALQEIIADFGKIQLVSAHLWWTEFAEIAAEERFMFAEVIPLLLGWLVVTGRDDEAAMILQRLLDEDPRDQLLGAGGWRAGELGQVNHRHQLAHPGQRAQAADQQKYLRGLRTAGRGVATVIRT